MASMRQNIARALIKTRIGLTTREIAEELQLKPAVVNMDLSKMAIEGTAIKGEYLEGEGQLWEITEKGIRLHATKDVLEETKKPVESQPKPKNKPLTEIKSVKQMDVKINAAEKTVEPEPQVIAPLNQKQIEALPEPRQSKVNPDNFKVWQIIDEMGVKVLELLESKQPAPIVIDNLEYKIKTLESLSELYNTKIGDTLLNVANDLRGLSA